LSVLDPCGYRVMLPCTILKYVPVDDMRSILLRIRPETLWKRFGSVIFWSKKILVGPLRPLKTYCACADSYFIWVTTLTERGVEVWYPQNIQNNTICRMGLISKGNIEIT
jgi:hypothetical protein